MDLTELFPLPDLDTLRSVICVQPHPDDNEVSAGATIAWLTQQGCTVTYVTVTDGAMGTYDPNLSREILASTRRREALEAGKQLGVSNYEWLDLPDGGNWLHSQARDRLVDIIRKHQPMAVMAPDPWLAYESHPDHRKTGMAAVEACLFSPFPHYGGAQSNTPPFQPEWVILYNTARPNLWVDAEQTWNQKINALHAHESQLSEDWERFSFFLTARAQQAASGQDFALAETFRLLPPILLHAAPETLEY